MRASICVDPISKTGSVTTSIVADSLYTLLCGTPNQAMLTFQGVHEKGTAHITSMSCSATSTYEPFRGEHEISTLHPG